MNFYEIDKTWYLISIPIILFGLFYLWYQKNNKDKKSIFLKENWNVKKILNFVNWKILFLSFGIIFLLLAVWRPQWGSEKEEINRKGLDLVFTVDVSKSMKALDFSKGNKLISRLDAVKYLISNFVEKRKNDRVALVEFAGDSFVTSPLTLDHKIFLDFLKNISSEDILKQGTNLSEAIEIAISRLEIKNDKERSKVILLFSDGDETINSNVLEMAKMARDKGIKIYTIGIGSEKGMPIPEGQDSWGNIIYKKYHGKTVIAKLNPKPLKEIAKITGAEYFHAENIYDLEELENQLERLPKKILKDEILNPASERYWIFNLVGLILLIIGFLIPNWKRIK